MGAQNFGIYDLKCAQKKMSFITNIDPVDALK